MSSNQSQLEKIASKYAMATGQSGLNSLTPEGSSEIAVILERMGALVHHIPSSNMDEEEIKMIISEDDHSDTDESGDMDDSDQHTQMEYDMQEPTEKRYYPTASRIYGTSSVIPVEYPPVDATSGHQDSQGRAESTIKSQSSSSHDGSISLRMTSLPEAERLSTRANSALSSASRSFDHDPLVSLQFIESWLPSLSKLELQVASLTDIWLPSKANQVYITCLEWYEVQGGADRFLLMHLASPLPTKSDQIWMRLERRPEQSFIQSFTNEARHPVSHSKGKDIATFACSKNHLVAPGNMTYLKNKTDKPLPLSFVLNILGRTYTALGSNANSSWLCALFNVLAAHHFCESPKCPSNPPRTFQKRRSMLLDRFDGTSRPSFRSEFLNSGSSIEHAVSQYSDISATDLRHRWRPSKARYMSVIHLKRYGLENNTHDFLFAHLASTATVHSQDTWVRLERRPQSTDSRSFRSAASLKANKPLFSDTAMVSCHKGDLEGRESESFYLKDEVDMPIPFLFMMDVLDIASKDMTSDVDDSLVYTSFIMDAAHQFCELTESNNSSYTETGPDQAADPANSIRYERRDGLITRVTRKRNKMHPHA